MFRRDRLTWLCYLMLAYYAYLQAVPGPLMPFLRREFGMNYTVASFHFSAFALGMIVAGAGVHFIADRWGRRYAFWGGGLGMALGSILFTIGSRPVMTIGAAFIMGAVGTWLLVMIQAVLRDHHGRYSSIALTEANGVASAGSGIAPLVVGSLQQSSAGWRMALIIGAVAWLLMFFWAFREPMTEGTVRDEKGAQSSARLPRTFHLYTLVIFLIIAVEWSIIYWGAEFIDQGGAYTPESAASIMSVFFLAIVISRAAGSWLTRGYPVGLLLIGASLIAGVGFLVFLRASGVLMIGGLFVAGLGIANLFPFGLSAALAVIDEHHSNAASARMSMTGGMAILIAPQILGSLADQTGIRTAYGLIVIILALEIAMTFAAYRLVGRYNSATD